MSRKVYLWNHESEPDPESWNGKVESADNIDLISGSFDDFVAGLRRLDEASEASGAKKKPWWKFW
jgi:hypothetical protein